MRKLARFGYVAWVVVYLGLSGLQFARAQNTSLQNYCSEDISIGELVSVENEVEIVSSLNSQSRKFAKTVSTSALQTNRYICDGDEIVVGPNSRASLYMKEPKSALRLDENTIFQVKSANAPNYGRLPNDTVKPEHVSFSDAIQFCRDTINRTWLNLKQGAVHLFTTEPQQLNINTPYMNASVEGTEFVVRVDPDRAEVSVIDGVVGVCNSDGYEVLTKGQRAAAEKDAAPVKVEPVDAVQWALYYPILGRNESTSNEALQAYELANAGQAEEAINILGNAPQDAYSLALQSTIFVVQNKLSQANDKVNDALAEDINSSSAWMAKSYLQQANIELEQAQASVEQANDLAPNDAIILARLAELKLSNDDKKGAKESADEATKANPEISRTQTVLGFMHLSLFDIEAAKASFEDAIVLDEADPLPRLGLGLVNIRKNNLKEGKKNIEIAVSLDPGNSLARSYLGKTYFDDNNNKQALEQLALAEELDQNDPTPNFYKAILLQSLNRPVAALGELRESLKNNENRAVYRSKLQLDSDYSSRSVSQANIYNELGFERLALTEGAKSVSHDYTNYSAHRNLADANLERPGHEIARVSELFISQMLQPVSINPAQSSLAESRLSNFTGLGPINTSFNEFNPLFTKEGTTGQVGLLYGENNTLATDVIASGLYNKTSYSISGFYYDTDGYFENHDQLRKSFSLFGQHEINANNNYQIAFRKTEQDENNTFVGFDQTDYVPDLTYDENVESYRIGYHLKTSKNNHLLFSTAYERADSSVALAENEFEIKADESGYQFEIQDIYSNNINNIDYDLVSGVSYFDSDRVDTEIEYGETFEFESEPRHFSYYSYAYPKYKNISSIIGLSYDDYEGESTEDQEYNPKFGIVWNSSNVEKPTTLRFAAFKTLKRSLLSNQTLEPTTIAGFTQFFDDFNGDKAKALGVGIEKVLSPNFSIGIDGLIRKLDVSLVEFEMGERFVTDADLEEEDVNFNIRYTKVLDDGSEIVINTAYQNESIENEPFFEGDQQILDLDTNRITIGLKYFNPNGLRLSLDPQYIDQSGDFIDRFFEEYSGEDSFFIVDASIGYRFKNKRALVTFLVKNMFDEEFQFQDRDPFNPGVAYSRSVFINVNFNL